jgi:hypothetical protein
VKSLAIVNQLYFSNVYILGDKSWNKWKYNKEDLQILSGIAELQRQQLK